MPLLPHPMVGPSPRRRQGLRSAQASGRLRLHGGVAWRESVYFVVTMINSDKDTILKLRETLDGGFQRHMIDETRVRRVRRRKQTTALSRVSKTT